MPYANGSSEQTTVSTVDEEKSFKLYQFLHIPASVFEFFCNRDKIV